MRLMTLLAFGCVSLLPVLRAADKPDLRENIDTTITETIRLIEAKDTAALIKFAISPRELQEKLEHTTLEKLAKEVEAQFPATLKMLKEIQGTKPRMNEDETRAVYELKELIDGHKEVKFVKEEKFWYLR